VVAIHRFAEVIADSGVSNALIQRRDATREELSSVYFLGILIGFAVAGLVLASGPMVAAHYGEPELSGLIAVVAVFFITACLGQQFAFLLQRDLRLRDLFLVELAAQGGGAATAIAMGVNGFGAYALAWGTVATAVIKSLCLLTIGMVAYRPTPRLRWREVRPFLAFGFFQMAESIADNLLRSIDRLIIPSLPRHGMGNLGIYQNAGVFGQRYHMSLRNLVVQVAYPVFSHLQHDPAAQRRAYATTVALVALVSFPALTGLAVLAEPAVLVMLGERWTEAIPLVPIMAGLAAVLCLNVPMGPLLLSRNRPGLKFAYTAAVIGPLAGALWWAGDRDLPTIAIAATTAIATVLLPLEFVLRWWLIRMAPGPWFRAIAVPAGMSAIMGAALVGLEAWLPAHPLARLLVGTGAGIAVYVVCLRVFWWRQAKTLWRAWRGRELANEATDA